MAGFSFTDLEQLKGSWDTAKGFLVSIFDEHLAQLAPLVPLTNVTYTASAVLVTDGQQTPSFSTLPRSDYYANSAIIGWASFTSGRNYILYTRLGALVYVWFHLEGTSNSTSITFSLPFAAASNNGSAYPNYTSAAQATDNSAALASPALVWLTPGSVVVTVFKDYSGASWTNHLAKSIDGSFCYPAA